MSRTALDLATLLTASWYLGTNTPVIPASSNTLDIALKQVSDHPALDRWKDDLIFIIGNIGTRSPLLAEALDAGVEACMLTPDSTTFTTYRILISKSLACHFLASLEIDKALAADFGKSLQQAYISVQKEIAETNT